MSTKTNDLIDFMQSLTREIGEEYDRIQKRSTEDPGTAGDQGEENWATIFKNWLPSDYHVVTKGRLLNEKGKASPQVDILILHPFYPKHLLNKKHYLTSGVIAAFECKNTLKVEHIEKSMKNSVEIRNLLKLKNSNYHEEMYSQLIYGLLAHSHSWKAEKSTPINNIQTKLVESDLKFVKHPRECLDLLCVSDLAVWSSYKQPMCHKTVEKDGKFYMDWLPFPLTGYGNSNKDMFRVDTEPYKNFTPIGALLMRLYRKLALIDKRLDEFAFYIGQAIGGGSKIEYRSWQMDILSKEAQSDLKLNFSKYQNKWLAEG